MIGVTLAAGVALAAVMSSHATTPRIAGPHRAVGVAVMWSGLIIRGSAVAALGRAFRTTVEVDPGQAVVTTGPYRFIRHPSYSGLLLILAGLGLALGTWIGLVACVVLPLPALLWRIHVEEAEMLRVLGDRYRIYAAHTKRLIPGVW